MNDLDYNPEKYYLIYGCENELRIFDYETGGEKVLRKVDGWIECIYPVEINGNKGFVVGGGLNELYDPDGKLRLEVEKDKCMLAFIDPNNPKKDRVIRKTNDWIRHIYPAEINGNRGFLIGGDFKGLYDPDGKLRLKVEKGYPLAFIDPNNPENNEIIKVADKVFLCVYPIPKGLYKF